MRKRDGVYVIDELANVGAYAGISANFAKAVAAIQRGGLEAYRPGRNEIDGSNVWANCDSPMLVAPEEKRAEVHRKYFDIQIPLTGEETYGLATFDPAAPGVFDEEKDVGFYRQELEWVTLKSGEFAIFWPRTCLHAPGCTRGVPQVLRKLIFKVAAV